MNKTKYLSKLIWGIAALWLMVNGSVALCAWRSVAISTFTCFAHVERANLCAPVIEHTAITAVDIPKHDIKVVATIQSDAELFGATVCYRLNGASTWTEGVMTLPTPAVEASTLTYSGAYYVISAAAESLVAGTTVEYYIKGRNKNFATVWPSSTTTQGFTISDFNAEPIDAATGGTVALHNADSTEGTTKIVIPANALSENKTIRITYKDPAGADVPARDKTEMLTTQAVAAYDFTPDRLRFGTQVAMTLWYSSTSVSVGDVSRLKAFYYDTTGSEWRMVGGTVNTSSHTVTFNTDHFTLYALFPVRTTANTYRPKERIITPASAEGINDWAQFDGLMGTTTTIKIYDVLGRLIRTIDAEPYQWNGKDDNGYIVESGVYIYQFKADVDGSMKLISGTIAVAK